jgi:phytoene dehydrogenase-like protein/ferredoxin-NADP reductase
MTSHYDVIVVGGGLGGLSAAATLARAGLHVRLFERHVQPGGYATTFVRRGHEFEVSLHELSGIGSPADRGPLWYVLADLGITEKVEFLPVRELYRTIAPGIDVRVPVGREAALDVLQRAFPHERRGLERLVDEVFAIQADALAMDDAVDVTPAVALTRFPRAARAAALPLARALDRELSDPRAKLVFAQLWGYYGLPPSRLSYVYFAGGTASYLRFGASYPKGKSQALSNAFVDVIEAAGGRVSLGCGVRRVLTERGRVTAVIDEREEHHTADHIVCNTNPVTTCVDLIGRDAVPEAYLRRLAASRAGLSSVTAYLVLRGTPAAVGLPDHETFLNATVDIEAQYRACLDVVPPDGLVVTAYNHVDPEFSPPGTTSVAVTALSDGAAWRRLDPALYPETKWRLAEAMVDRVDAVFPGFRERIEVAVVATPISNMRYTDNWNGSIYGFEMTVADNPAWRPAHEGPLDRLWFCGAWTRPGGGYEPCIESGHAVGAKVLRAVRSRRRPGGTGRVSGTPRSLVRVVGDYATLLRDAPELVGALRRGALRTALNDEPLPREGALRRDIDRFHPRRFPVRVVAVEDHTESSRLYRLAPLAGTFPPFEAGQYIAVHLEAEGVQTSRAYSLASAPGRLSTVEIVVRRVPRGFVAGWLIDHVREGDVLSVSGPEGDFVHNPLTDTDELVLLAGGSGIAPFRALVEDVLDRGRPLDLTLLYGTRSEQDVIFGERLRSLAARYPDRFRMALVVSEPGPDWEGQRGLLDADCVRRNVAEGDRARKTWFLCGPPEMCALSEAALLELGVAPARLHLEAYGPPREVAREPDWPAEVPAGAVFRVTVEGRGAGFAAPARDPLMNSLERAGLTLPHLCRAGVCGTCRLRLLEGRVYTPRHVTLRQTDRMEGFIHPCLSYPLSDLVLSLP